ncbi:uncharacterized protein G2W53_014030 [Senna tora]|uniref:Uncharacterized protein n=1 Tax=Senna tora TaxID=362788 RepID=A0A834WR62_9FABA|nr:uncharacterized protein G2W53_014030 [Senna tora]
MFYSSCNAFGISIDSCLPQLYCEMSSGQSSRGGGRGHTVRGGGRSRVRITIDPSPPVAMPPPPSDPSPPSSVHSTIQPDTQAPHQAPTGSSSGAHPFSRPCGKDPADGQTWIYPGKDS